MKRIFPKAGTLTESVTVSLTQAAMLNSHFNRATNSIIKKRIKYWLRCRSWNAPISNYAVRQNDNPANPLSPPLNDNPEAANFPHPDNKVAQIE